MASKARKKTFMTGVHMHKRAHAIQLGIGAAILFACSAAARAEIGWSVDAGASHTDNATLADTNAKSDTLTSLGATVAYNEQGRRFQASLNGTGNYIRYLDDTYDPDFQSHLTGVLVGGIIPEKFLWTAEDTYGQIAVNQFEPVTPDNRQNINTFTTGPDLIARLDAQSELQFSGRYIDTRYEESNQVNADRLKGSLTFRRHVSDTTFWGVVASDQRIKYDAPGDPSYTQPEIYGTWQSAGSRQTLALDVGANRVDTDTGTFTRPLIHASWNRTLATSWKMNVDLRSEYQNTADQFLVQGPVNNPATAQLGIAEAPAAAYDGDLSFAYQRPRTRFSIGGGYSRLNYVVANGLNQSSWYGTFEIRRRHTPRIEGFIDYRLDKRTYEDDPARDDLRQRAEVGLDWRLGKSVYLTAAYQYNHSTSDSVVNRYTANMAYLMFSFRQGTITEPRALNP